MGIVKRAKLAVEDYLKLPKMRRRDPETGKEIVDPVPLAPPIGWFKQPSMFDQVREMVRGEHLRMAALASGAETFEDANDFDVDDDIFPASPHEMDDFAPLEDLQARRQTAFREEFLRERQERQMKRERRQWAEEDAQASSARSASSGAPAAPKAAAEGEAQRS